jgi:hypothetical protein
MKEHIETLFKEYFSHYKTYQTMIDVIIVILIGVFNIGIGFFLNKKIEKVKLKNSQELSTFSSELNLLNKKSEIKFKKYQIGQADAIKKLYSILVDIKCSTNSIFNNKFNSSPHYEFKNNLNKWVKNYMIFHKIFSKNKILFSERLLDLTKEHFDNLHKIFTIIFKKINDIEEMEEYCQGQIENYYTDEYEEEDKIIGDLKKLRKELDKGNVDFNFKKLNEELENEYKKLLN